MADLSTLQTLGLITSAISSVGKIYAGISEQKAFEESAKVARRKAAYEAEKQRKEVKYLVGKQKLLYAKAGVDLLSGSPLAFMAYTAAEGEREAVMMEAEGAFEAAEYKRRGRKAMIGGLTEGVSSYLTASMDYSTFGEKGRLERLIEKYYTKKD